MLTVRNIRQHYQNNKIEKLKINVAAPSVSYYHTERLSFIDAL